MKILVTGACGFVGCSIIRSLLENASGLQVVGVDNFIRPGSERNRLVLAALGVRVCHADIRNTADIEALPPTDWVIDAAANPSVLAGVDGKSSSRQVIEHNMFGTVNLLEYCKRHGAGFLLLSTSRVYSFEPLSRLQMDVANHAFVPQPNQDFPPGLSPAGVTEDFPTAPPVSLYGATKLASELLALEYGETFGLPVWINRCGVLAGAGQFGRADQGIFSYWLNTYLRRLPLRYIGFDGAGHQVRDCLHPRDLASLISQQLNDATRSVSRIQNVSGGAASAISLAQLSHWCAERFGPHVVTAEPKSRPFDIPWMVLDSSLACRQWDWKPQILVKEILEEIASHAEQHPEWLEISGS
jgi:CDP-paratose 2-epimerase